MAANVDGSITISTKIDDSGFNSGVKNMSLKMINLRTSIKAAFATLPQLIAAPFKIVGNLIKSFMSSLANGISSIVAVGLAVFALTVTKIVSELREAIIEFIERDLKGTKIARDLEGIKSQFVELKASIANAFVPLVQVAIPYIKQVLSWLIKAFNWVAMVTAAFLGQKEVLQVIAGSAQKIA